MKPSHLFSLNSDEKFITEELNKKIINTINNNNEFISFSKYMEMALYDPEYGYYNNLSHKFGVKGDFITAPNISKLFAVAITNQIKELCNNFITANILEIGGGNGQLMLDILSIIGQSIDKYYILELSSNLAQLQQQRLQEQLPQYSDKVIWLNNLPDLFDGIILANEVLDAQPFERVIWQNGDILQIGVGVDKKNDLLYKSKIADTQLKVLAKNLQHNNKISESYTSEINLNNRGFIKTLSQSLNKGAIILIDYGYAQREYYSADRKNGTLRGFFRHHQLEDILLYTGLIDITASVDFTAIAEIAIENNLDLIGYTSQANFLINCDILEFMAVERAKNSNLEYLQLTNQLMKLTSPNEMGDIFKVIAFSKNFEFCEWCGFNRGNRSHLL